MTCGDGCDSFEHAKAASHSKAKPQARFGSFRHLYPLGPSKSAIESCSTAMQRLNVDYWTGLRSYMAYMIYIYIYIYIYICGAIDIKFLEMFDA